MSPEAQRIAIARAEGWRFWTDGTETLLLSPVAEWPRFEHFVSRGMREGDGRPGAPIVDITMVPEYLRDGRAIREAILALVTEKVAQADFSEHLTVILNRRFDGAPRCFGSTPFHVATAEPADLSKALLLTLDLWRGDA